MAFDRLLGEAYILMRADGSLIPKDIKKTGLLAGDSFGEGFDESLAKFEKDSLDRFRRKLAQSTAEIDFSDFRKQFGSVDDTLGAIQKKMRLIRKEGGLSTEAYNRVKRAMDEWGAATIETERQQSKLNRTVVSFSATFRKGIEGMWRRYAEDLAKASRTGDFSKFRVENEKTSLTLQRLSRELKDNAVYLDLSGREIDDITLKIEKWAKAQTTVDMSRTGRIAHRETSRISKAFDKIDGGTERIVLGFGRAFGKGSRNNFLNFVGSFVSGLTTLVTAVPLRLARTVAHIGDSFGEAFSASRALGIGRVASASRGLSAVFASGGGLVGGVIALIAGLAAFGIALPAIVSLVSGLVGAVVALTGAVAIGLVGALLVLTPVLLGAVLGFGVLAGAVATFVADDKMKKWVKRNLIKPWKDFTKQVYPEIKSFLTFVGSGFDDLLADIRPGVERFFTDFQRLLGDSTSQNQLKAFSDSMGRIFTELGAAAASFTDGLLAFFIPILPYAERLATYIGDIAERFSKWANSAGGQQSIADFMERAYKAGKDVFGIITTIGSIIGTLFSSGEKNAGASFLEDIRLKLEEIDAYLDSKKGRQALKDWFSNAKNIGRDVARIAVEIGKMIDYLDSPAGRENALLLMDALVGIAGLGTKLASVADAVGKIVGFITSPPLIQVYELLTALQDKAVGKPKLGGQGNEPALVGLPNNKSDNIFNTPGAAPQVQVIKSTPTLLKEYLVSIKVDDLLYEEKKRAISDFVFRGKRIPVEGNEALWNATKGTVASYIFDSKTVPVAGNDKSWATSRGAIASYKFDGKTVKVNADTASARASIASLKEYLNTLPASRTIRIAGVNSIGGIAMATGGTVFGPTRALIGDAGPEAVVPLRRSLNQVDPSVRALSAIAQGMKIPAMGSGGIAGVGGAPVIVEAGAVQVTTSATSAPAVGRVVLNSLADALAGVG